MVMHESRLICGAVASLVLITIVMLAWQHYGMEIVFRIDARQNYNVTAIDDRNAGGNSWAAVRLDDGVIDWECHVRTGFAWPFCELAFSVAPLPRGYDFSRYDSFVIRLQRKGCGIRRLRLFLRNFEEGRSSPNDQMSWRQNELQFDAPDVMQELRIPMRQMNVAPWWLADRKIMLGQALVDVSTVPTMQLSTAGLPEEANQSFRIEYIEFRGKRFTSAEVAVALLGMWVSAALVLALGSIFRRRRGRS